MLFHLLFPANYAYTNNSPINAAMPWNPGSFGVAAGLPLAFFFNKYVIHDLVIFDRVQFILSGTFCQGNFPSIFKDFH